ncbi:hypothetical protein X975_14272, partial [Stegodyphus mimosarum]
MQFCFCFCEGTRFHGYFLSSIRSRLSCHRAKIFCSEHNTSISTWTTLKSARTTNASFVWTTSIVEPRLAARFSAPVSVCTKFRFGQYGANKKKEHN